MTRKIRKHVKRIQQLVTPVISEQTDRKEFEFTLNKSRTDKLHCCIETNSKKNTVKIADVTLLVLINETWHWVVRYDDHGGSGLLHRHERVSLDNESETTVPLPVRKNGNKKKLTEWAISDIRRNYLNYRKKFLNRSKITLY